MAAPSEAAARTGENVVRYAPDPSVVGYLTLEEIHFAETGLSSTPVLIYKSSSQGGWTRRINIYLGLDNKFTPPFPGAEHVIAQHYIPHYLREQPEDAGLELDWQQNPGAVLKHFQNRAFSLDDIKIAAALFTGVAAPVQEMRQIHVFTNGDPTWILHYYPDVGEVIRVANGKTFQVPHSRPALRLVDLKTAVIETITDFLVKPRGTGRGKTLGELFREHPIPGGFQEIDHDGNVIIRPRRDPSDTSMQT